MLNFFIVFMLYNIFHKFLQNLILMTILFTNCRQLSFFLLKKLRWRFHIFNIAGFCNWFLNHILRTFGRYFNGFCFLYLFDINIIFRGGLLFPSSCWIFFIIFIYFILLLQVLYRFSYDFLYYLLYIIKNLWGLVLWFICL